MTPAATAPQSPRQTPRQEPQPSPRQTNDDGQMIVLIIGYVMLALLVVTVVIGISSVYLEHKRLLSLADGASLAAADSYTLGEVAGDHGTPSAVLGSGRVRSVAADFIARSPSSARFDQLGVSAATGSPDGSTAVVVLTAAVHPPVVNFLVPDGIRIEAVSTARSRLTR